MTAAVLSGNSDVLNKISITITLASVEHRQNTYSGLIKSLSEIGQSVPMQHIECLMCHENPRNCDQSVRSSAKGARCFYTAETGALHDYSS